MSNNSFRCVSSRQIYENGWLCLREDEVIRPGGSKGTFGVVKMKPGSSILALNGAREVYLVKEHKYAVQRETLEVISGGIEENETPLEAATRELQEEAGLKAGRMIDMGCIDPFTSVISSPNYLFLALDVEEGEPKPDEGESLQLVRLPLSEALEKAMNGGITHAASCILLLRAERELRS